MSSDQLENELIRKITELQQEAKEHQLVLDAFKSVEPERKCFRLIGGVLIEKTVKDVKPSLEENLVNIDKAINNLNETVVKRREERLKQPSSAGNTIEGMSNSKELKAPVSSTNGLLA